MGSLFSTASFITCLLAAQVGAGPGDVSALTSINVVSAAFMGHLFLSEKLRIVHVVMVASSLVGAVLISKPPFIFGGETSFGLGYVLAILSGLTRAAMFVCARKAGKVSVSLLACGSAVVGVPIIGLMIYTGAIDEPPLGPERA